MKKLEARKIRWYNEPEITFRGGMPMTLQQLKYVIEVADRGSITEAAKSLFIAQPSLSAAKAP